LDVPSEKKRQETASLHVDIRKVKENKNMKIRKEVFLYILNNAKLIK
jgi:hypothetical protein